MQYSMQISRESNDAKYQITSYTANSVTINNTQVFTSSIILMPEYLEAWPVQDIKALTQNNILQLANLQPELVLLGSGETLVFPEPAVISALYATKIGLEVMTTTAACRTYAALSAEGRKVLAALIL